MKQGFTLPELVIVISILVLLLSLITINLLRPQHRASTSAALATLMADLRQQQLKAMVGDTEGSGTPISYGVYLNTNSYILFRGTTYATGNPGNFSVPLESPLQITATFPGSQIVFQAGSGEVAGFVSGANTVTVSNPNGSTTNTLTIDRYGTVVSAQ